MELGEREEFDVLVATHRKGIHAYLVGRTGSRDTAADLSQDTFVRAWQHRSDIRGLTPERVRFYLVRIAANIANDRARKLGREGRQAQEVERQAALAAVEQDRVVEAGAFADAVDAAILRLPEDLRVALSMQVLGGLTSAEIGTSLGRPPGTVRSWLHEARRRLAHELADWMEGERR